MDAVWVPRRPGRRLPDVGLGPWRASDWWNLWLPMTTRREWADESSESACACVTVTRKNNYRIWCYPSLRRTGRGDIRYLEISCWLFLSPSTVKGDAPVSNSYVSTPTPHQSTAWNQTKKKRKKKRQRSFRIKSPRHQSIDGVEGVDQCIFHVSMFSSS